MLKINVRGLEKRLRLSGRAKLTTQHIIVAFGEAGASDRLNITIDARKPHKMFS